jgi:hypothetical protein
MARRETCGWERFLPWHRAYLYEFEQNLQDFAKDIMVPYWDWTMPQYRPHHPETGWRIPKAFQAFLRENAAKHMIFGEPDEGDPHNQFVLDPKPTKKRKPEEVERLVRKVATAVRILAVDDLRLLRVQHQLAGREAILQCAP